ncbi:Alpha/beta hydrolase family protein [Stieleria maiorica]|uniref:Alpha/beta hydrolase family protein n=1 Tax=Stieleria maiorica TaxID=2795974 RepID=A0A5B9MEJ7_9BACT|nr:prolyl oligopeptidase family serine peptidase [Stieleria maiorica]QEF98400.1 Alpha/beta hydrolase family protein [Stieleria maiorica]
MNRFDATTIWKSVSEQVPDGGDSTPHPVDALDAEEAARESSGGAAADWSEAIGAQTFFVPLHYESNYRYPLIVWLHSDGFNENQVCHVMPHVSSRNYVATGVRAPAASDPSGHRFAWSNSVAAVQWAERSVLEAIDRTAAQYSVHAQRIILAGYQNGGTMAARIAMRHPERFAAAISLGGSFQLPKCSDLDRQRLKERRLPMLWQRSIESEFYDQTRLVSEIQAASSIGAQVEIRQYRNDDEMNTAVLSDLDRWIMNHVVNGAPVAKLSPWDTSPTSFSDN